jgi:AraC family transcriptional regulator of adaptative response/methylated-DNA-[protein]-cysteine methyltransferase
MINSIKFDTKLGEMIACANTDGLCLLEFTDRRILDWEFKDISKRLDDVIVPRENEHLKQIRSEITEYMDGYRKVFNVPLVPLGTEFQQSVWKVLLQIPYGDTWSYLQLANKISNANAVRAVASANGFNKIGIVIPCHRVIGSNGKLIGYGGGLDRKKWLLDLESHKALF